MKYNCTRSQPFCALSRSHHIISAGRSSVPVAACPHRGNATTGAKCFTQKQPESVKLLPRGRHSVTGFRAALSRSHRIMPAGRSSVPVAACPLRGNASTGAKCFTQKQPDSGLRCPGHIVSCRQAAAWCRSMHAGCAAVQQPAPSAYSTV